MRGRSFLAGMLAAATSFGVLSTAMADAGRAVADLGRALPSRMPVSKRGHQVPASWARSQRSHWTHPKPGWSVRQGKRMAAKARNRQRNRAAHR